MARRWSVPRRATKVFTWGLTADAQMGQLDAREKQPDIKLFNLEHQSF